VVTNDSGDAVIVAGVMSGTSADGINVALVRFDARRSTSGKPALIGHSEYPYAANVRRAVLAAMNAQTASVADLSRLNFLLGELYADAVLATQKRFRVKADLVGCHGQTIYHQGESATYLGRRVAVTWQTGEGAVVAARVGAPCVSDFRPADMAAGGKGAPLVPFLDYLFYRDSRVGRIVQNIGGIANLTAIPAGAGAEKVIAFDTGPGNMVIDAVMERLFGKRFDRGGRMAASGTVDGGAIAKLIRTPFFREKPPKTAGREEFGREFVARFVRLCGTTNKANVAATATAFTARSIADAVQRFVLRRAPFAEMVVSGGGAKNPTLMGMLANELSTLGVALRTSDEFGIPAEAKEAVAFALMAYETWHRRPSNVPSATGAKRSAVLGKISYV
jgi:anhydro-N-acetylmuramic acid kinase